MKRTHGPETSAIWLLADSNPAAWQKKLEGPLDRRHPTRHNIWTPIEQVIQRHLFEQCGSRMTDELFIRNAVEDAADKSRNEPLAQEITEYRRLLSYHKPVLVLCFGEFAFEFARRAQQEEGRTSSAAGLSKSWRGSSPMECPTSGRASERAAAATRFYRARQISPLSQGVFWQPGELF